AQPARLAGGTGVQAERHGAGAGDRPVARGLPRPVGALDVHAGLVLDAVADAVQVAVEPAVRLPQPLLQPPAERRRVVALVQPQLARHAGLLQGVPPLDGVLHLDVPVVHAVHDHDGGAHLPRLGDVVAGGPDLPVVAGLAVLRGLDLPDDLVAD